MRKWESSDYLFEYFYLFRKDFFFVNFVKSSKSETQHEIHKTYSHIIKHHQASQRPNIECTETLCFTHLCSILFRKTGNSVCHWSMESCPGRFVLYLYVFPFMLYDIYEMSCILWWKLACGASMEAGSLSFNEVKYSPWMDIYL